VRFAPVVVELGDELARHPEFLPPGPITPTQESPVIDATELLKRLWASIRDTPVEQELDTEVADLAIQCIRMADTDEEARELLTTAIELSVQRFHITVMERFANTMHAAGNGDTTS
jgi:hypothetical protein